MPFAHIDNLPVEGPLTFAEHSYEKMMPPGFTLSWALSPHFSGPDSDPLERWWYWDSWDNSETGYALGTLEMVVTTAWECFAKLPRARQIELSEKYPTISGIFLLTLCDTDSPSRSSI